MGLDDTSKILVFDIEGTDSVERGEDRLVRISFVITYFYVDFCSNYISVCVVCC